MKIVVLGAAANMAQPALRYLVKQRVVSEIVLTDLHEGKLVEIQNELGEKASYQKLDITNELALDDILTGANLLMNFVGPYYRFQTIALQAAIAHRVHYIDLCDDYDVTMEALALHDRAKESGITAITGMGASPGITNVLARLGADQLDKVEEINTYWVVGDAEPSGFGALVHMFHIIEGKVPTFQDGEEKWIRAFQHDTAKRVDFGGPVGKVTLYHVGHPEPVTLPKYIPNVKKVTNYGALLPEFQNPMFKTLVDLGLTSEEPIEFKGDQVAPLEFLLHLFHAKQEEAKKRPGKKYPSVSAARIEVLGEKNGAKASYTFTKSAFDKMDQGTSIPAAIVATQLLNGEISEVGVVAPEALQVKKIVKDLSEVGYFADGKGFQVDRVIGEKADSASIMEKTIFKEFWD